MRTTHWLWASFGTIAAVGVLASACIDPTSDCALIYACSGGVSGGTTTTTSSTTGTGGGGAPPSGCVPSDSKDPVADSCGVFVSSSLGVDGNEADRGTKTKPFKTIGAALMKADVARVYACAESFTEAVTVSAAVDLFGGLDCKGWAYVGATKKTTLTALANMVPLSLAGDARIEDFAIKAADATVDGGSSIAVIADQVKASFARCDFVAGLGKAGLAGTTPIDPVGPMDSADVAIKGNDGAAACMAMSSQLGGDAKENALCPFASGGPIGGSGGQGTVPTGGNGEANPATTQTALGGVGQPNLDPMSLWSCAVGNGGGQSGTNGAGGTPGDGATGVAALGTLDKAGYTGNPGQPGGLAPPGQGGGGGGGAKGKPLCAGASGGGGGAGGCGGKGGLGGNAGGASIALVSLGATLSFDKVTIKTGVGGDGGNGGDGQGGGVGGKGGTGGNGDVTPTATLKACDGGAGGQGGTGGKGGGARGGHAIGIAYTGAVVPLTKGAAFTKGTAGKGGAGPPT